MTISTTNEWRALGVPRTLGGHGIFTIDAPSIGPERHEPLLILHGFPSSSFDYAGVLDGLRQGRRVLLLDDLGYGLSDKPDQRYTMALQADLAQAFLAELGVERLALMSHDMGDTVGGELLARQLEGTWPVEVTRRVLTNGSIYIGMAQLSPGQQLLLALPDERMPADGALDAASVQAGLAAT
ncbi:MAG TPA: alpha/beta hydrolase, partial [Acidimicrobiales bacterium]